MARFAEVAFTPAVKAVQAREGSRRSYARLEGASAGADRLGEDEAAFLAERDSFYLATVSETGWPYVQHRGGPKGFVRALDPGTLAFADLRGNKQYVSVGNLTKDDRVAMIFVDYPRRTRLKVLAHARLVTRAEDPALFERVGAGRDAERVMVLTVEAFDWNCPQHLTPRFTVDEVQELARPLLTRLEALERENAELKAKLAAT